MAKVTVEQIIETLQEMSILEVNELVKAVEEAFTALKEKYSIISDARGFGLMQGIELTIPAGDVIADCINNGLLLVGAGTNVIRFVPALIITEEEMNEAMEILEKCLEKAETK